MKKFIVLLAVLLLVSPAFAATETTKAVKGKKTTKVTKAAKAEKVAKSTKKHVAEESGPSTAHWVLQAQGGPDFMLSSVPEPVSIISPGWGYNISAGYAFSDAFSLSLLSGYQVHACSVTSSGSTTIHIGESLSYMPMQVVAQYTAPGDDIRFFGFLGVGLAINNISYSIAVDDSFIMPSAMGTTVTGTTTYITYSAQQTDFLLSPGLGLGFKLSDKVNLFVQTKLEMDFISQPLADLLSSIPSATKKFDTPQLYLPLQVGVNFSL